MWANLVLFIFNLFTFQKYQGHISLGNCKKPVPFPRIEVLLMQKNLRLLFLSEEVCIAFDNVFQ